MVKIIQKTEERDMEYVVVFFEGVNSQSKFYSGDTGEVSIRNGLK